MREVRVVSLHFEEEEIIEALELLCHKHHPAVAVNFVRTPEMVMSSGSGHGHEITLTFRTDTHPDLALKIDAHPERPAARSSDETRIFPVRRGNT